MSFPRYPKYKDSGVEWLGEVPEHWALAPLWTFFRRVKRIGFEDEELLSVYRDHGVVPKASRSDNFNKPSDDLSVYQLITPGDLAINKMKAWQGSVGVSDHRGIVSPAYFVYEALHASNGRYLHYLMRSLRYISAYFSISKGIRPQQWDLEPQLHSRLPLTAPPPGEQASIAAFLDNETLKIDALIAEQQRLMDLLKEKRQAVISHCVTRGLNPGAAMKDSGVEWLGSVPAHWGIHAFKNLAVQSAKTFTDGDWIEAPYITDEGVRLIQTGNVAVGFYKEQGFRYVSEDTFRELGCTEVKPRDVLICRLDGPVGRACLAPDLGGPMITSVDNAILKCRDEVHPEFVVALLSSVPWISWIDALCRVGGGFRLRISRSQLGEIRVPMPPLAEQVRVARYLTAETAKWDGLALEAQRAIELLQERRTALISAAVTGQIDVRAFTATKSS